MDFFARQDAARRASRLLIVAFVLAMGAMALAVQLAVGAVSSLHGGAGSAEGGADGLATPALALTGLIWVTVLFGAFFRALDVRAGGEALARRFGASEVDGNTRDEKERRLSNTVAEMAIAASIPPPGVWLLRRERSINAFVVGGGGSKGSSARSPARPVALVVTRGALDALEADELRGVIAHEIAHVAQGDLALNMRLLVALGGLSALDEVGRTLIGSERLTGGRGSRGAIDSLLRTPAHPAALVGWPLRAIGSVGVLAGALIRAAVSRGREHLADATAVQLTREPTALASALATIRDAGASPPGEGLHTAHAEELAHLCFHAGERRGGRFARAWRRALASHPPLQSRIDALDPHVDVKRRHRATREAAPAAPPAPSVGCGAAVVVSDRLQLLLADGIDGTAALCVLFAVQGGRGHDFVDALGRGFDARLAERVSALGSVLRAELESDRLAVVERACEVVRDAVGMESRRRLLLELERVLAAGGELGLDDYALLRLLRRRLEVEFPVLASGTDGASEAGPTARSFESMGEQFALLLSLLVESSGAPPPALEAEFRRVLSCYTATAHPRRASGEPGLVTELESAFQTLAVQPLAVRRAFVQHCSDIVEADSRVTPGERTLLELIAASLDDDRLAA